MVRQFQSGVNANDSHACLRLFSGRTHTQRSSTRNRTRRLFSAGISYYRQLIGRSGFPTPFTSFPQRDIRTPSGLVPVEPRLDATNRVPLHIPVRWGEAPTDASTDGGNLMGEGLSSCQLLLPTG